MRLSESSEFKSSAGSFSLYPASLTVDENLSFYSDRLSLSLSPFRLIFTAHICFRLFPRVKRFITLLNKAAQERVRKWTYAQWSFFIWDPYCDCLCACLTAGIPSPWPEHNRNLVPGLAQKMYLTIVVYISKLICVLSSVPLMNTIARYIRNKNMQENTSYLDIQGRSSVGQSSNWQ